MNWAIVLAFFGGIGFAWMWRLATRLAWSPPAAEHLIQCDCSTCLDWNYRSSR